MKEKDRYLRQLLIGDIEGATGRPLIVYFSQLDQQINHTDPDDLSEILSGVAGDSADLVIQTPGGLIDAAEKIIGILRRRFTHWRVFVPSWAKSAGTVVALASNEIVLGLNSELGPIDPHFFVNGIQSPCELISQDPTQQYVLKEMARLAVERTRALAKITLETGMMHGKESAKIEDTIAKISSANGYMSHGAVIDYSEAINLGLHAKFLEPADDLWQKIWLLYCMYDYDTKAKNIGRIFEGSKYSIARLRQ